ncbi:major facilitator superfamily domain-containing protein [Aspergillus pseudoustus]|uniref:Major facilitator superfamily domain-containing protein n=1 Tax=Aspergillus pseudoustus TaxID=1810923 RepID=A0ABR4KIF7_9EURO
MARQRSSSVDSNASSSEATDETPLLAPDSDETTAPTPQPVSWASIPRKGQLAAIVFARLAEPLSERSLTSYIFYQLKWFDPTLDASEIAKRAGYMTAVFAAAQCCTSMWWGRAADHPRLGRKRVLLLGLMGSAISALGMGFSTSFHMALCFRFLAGALNGNVGVLRTMVSEIVADKRYRPRAFLLLPMCFNIGVIIGPLISGFLADPFHSISPEEAHGSGLKPASGLQWLVDFPYALPNLFFATVLGSAALMVILGLDETHPQRKHLPDRGRRLGKLLLRRCLGRFRRKGYPDDTSGYAIIPSSDIEVPTVGTEEHASTSPPPEERTETGFRAIVTQNVILIMLQRFLQSLHISAFNSIFFTLLPTPRSDNTQSSLPFRFTGGLGLSSQKVGFANTTIGMVGIPLQLLVYPRLIGRLGAKKSYLIFLPLSILAYCATPYLVLLPDNIGIIWTCLSAVLIVQVLSRTFVNPATVLLVNDCAPSPKLLGTIHGLASSISSAARILGPTVGGTTLGWGLSHNFVGLPLWLLGILAVINWVVLLNIGRITRWLSI